MPRESLMDEHPDLRVVVAELFVEGASNKEIADRLNQELPERRTAVHPETIVKYRRHPDVEAMISMRRRERINRLTSKIDAKIESWLNNAKIQHDVETLLKIRKELMPERLKDREDSEMSGDKLVEAMFDEAYGSPEFAERMMEAVKRVENPPTKDAAVTDAP